MGDAQGIAFTLAAVTGMCAAILSWWGVMVLRTDMQRRRAAERAANELLRDVLSDAEYRQLTGKGYLVVPSPGIDCRTYRVPYWSGYVDVCQSGRLVWKLCLQPVQDLPSADFVLLHKLMIEGNEREYLRLANIVPAEGPLP